jgi:hypothetical protein
MDISMDQANLMDFFLKGEGIQSIGWPVGFPATIPLEHAHSAWGKLVTAWWLSPWQFQSIEELR